MDKLLSPILHRPFYIFLILWTLTLLSSCSHVRRKDGPPSFYVDAASIPNAAPKVEPLSKYGNLTSYRVFGKRYYTLHSSKNYEQVGIASWYGTKFHARRTSSGEPYNMLAMTAAHKTLPLPTYVEVTNLKNQRRIIVKVNDRGPFEGNRLIDLSYVAAKKLGMTGHGTTKVKVKAIDPIMFNRQSLQMASNFTSNTSSVMRSHYSHVKNRQTDALYHQHATSLYLQVGSFRNKSHAEKLKRRLLSLVETPVKISKSPFHRQLYRVQIGPIKDTIAANKMTSRLKRLGIKTNRLNGV